MAAVLEASIDIQSGPVPSYVTRSKYAQVNEACKKLSAGQWFYATGEIADETERSRVLGTVSSAVRSTKAGCRILIRGNRVVVVKK